jgi:adenine/guanine phosphoribosyltransferase-like PRPP-binding protein
MNRIVAPDSQLQTTRPGERLPYLALIRGMLDRDQVAAARALLSVALAEQLDASELVRISEVLAVPRAVKRAVRDADRAREYRWLVTNAASFRGRWVAVVGDDLVATAASLKELLQAVKLAGREHEALVHHID